MCLVTIVFSEEMMDRNVSWSDRAEAGDSWVAAPRSEQAHLGDSAEIGAATRWKKGRPSPNPGGRPKSRTISEALREKLSQIKDDDPQQRTYAQVLAENLISLARSKERNSVAAAVEIANRVEGRVHERAEFSDITQQLQTNEKAKSNTN